MAVVDASLAVKVFVAEQFTDQARALASNWERGGVELFAPDFMASEFTSALRKKIQEGILSVDDVKNFVSE